MIGILIWMVSWGFHGDFLGISWGFHGDFIGFNRHELTIEEIPRDLGDPSFRRSWRHLSTHHHSDQLCATQPGRGEDGEDGWKMAGKLRII